MERDAVLASHPIPAFMAYHGAGVGGLTSAGGHDGKKRSMFLKGPVCHDILEHVSCGVSGRFLAFAVVVSVTVTVLILISRLEILQQPWRL